MSWRDVANEMGIASTKPADKLGEGGRTSFPTVTGIVRWLGRQAAAFTRASDR